MGNWRWNGLPQIEKQKLVCDDKKDPAKVLFHIAVLTERAFKRPATAFDFEVAASILELIKDLPGSHGMTSVAKILRGKAKTCTKNPNFGKCEGMKEYPQAKLFSLAEDIELWMLANNLCSDEDNKLEWDRSDPIYTRKKADHLLSTLIIQMIRDNAATYGIAAVVPKTTPEMDFKKFKPVFLRWLYTDKFDEIRDALDAALNGGEHRAHAYGPDCHSEWDANDCLNTLMRQESTIPVFSLKKSNLKNGNFSISAVVSGCLVPQNWVGRARTNNPGTGPGGWSELREACSGECWGQMHDTEIKPKVAASVKVKVEVDVDGNILNSEVKVAKGFAGSSGTFGAGPEAWPNLLVNKDGPYVHTFSFGKYPPGTLLMNVRGRQWEYKEGCEYD